MVHSNQRRTYQVFFYFILLLHGIQDGFAFSMKKTNEFLFSVGKYFEVV